MQGNVEKVVNVSLTLERDDINRIMSVLSKVANQDRSISVAVEAEKLYSEIGDAIKWNR